MNATLISTGRRTGQPRPAKLYVWPDGDDRFVLIGSAAGQDEDPAWVHNLRAAPRCTLRFGKVDRAGQVHEVEPGPERDRLWAMVVEAFRYYGTYQRKTSRSCRCSSSSRMDPRPPREALLPRDRQSLKRSSFHGSALLL